MKNARTILSHLGENPQFKFLKQHSCYIKYIKLLGYKYQKAIAFVYIKNNTLFIAVKHPGFKMEFNYNKDLLKSLLTQLSNLDKECTMLKASKVVIFHSKYHQIERKTETVSTIPCYHELASGRFDIHCKDKDLQDKFKQIQQSIICSKL